MQYKTYSMQEAKIVLNSPIEVPFNFTIIVTETKDLKNSECSFEVTGQDPLTNLRKTYQYRLENREHKSYLDFFSKLAEDFGLRLPQNRQQAEKNSFKAIYRNVLCKNLVPEMLYGYGDPAVIKVVEGLNENDVWYYLVVTSNDAPNSFPICRSKDLINWEFVSFVFPKGHKPECAADGEFISDYWAPEMHKIGNEFRVYFVARDKNTLELCIGMAKSLRPEGPFIADKEPILKGNMIDPHVFIVDNETAFLFWKEDNNAVWPSRLIGFLYENPTLTAELFLEKEDQITASFILTLWPWIQTLKSMEGFLVEQILIEAVISKFSAFQEGLSTLAARQTVNVQKSIKWVLEVMRTPVYAQKLSPDGSGFVGERKKIIENDQEWEAHLVEGMWVTKHLEQYYMFYSGNDFSTDQYGTGVAIANSLLGPYNKMQKPFLQSTMDWWAPGHPSVVIGPNGEHQLFLHAYFPEKAGYKEFRVLLSVPIAFKNDSVLLI